MLSNISFQVNGFSCAGQVAVFAQDCQQQNQWCWAAAAVSIARYFNAGRPLSQCSVAASVLHRACCQGFVPRCVDQNPAESPCDLPHLTGDALLANRNVGSNTAGGPLLFTDLQAKLAAGNLIACGMDEQTGSHALVVFGHLTATSGSVPPQQLLLVADPLSPGQGLPVLYANFLENRALRTRWRDAWVAGPAPGDPAPPPTSIGTRQTVALSVVVGNLLARTAPARSYGLRVVSLDEVVAGTIFSVAIAARRYFFDGELAGLSCDMPLADGLADWSVPATFQYRDDPSSAAPEVAAPVYLEIPALNIHALELPGGMVQSLTPVFPSLYDRPPIISQVEFAQAIQPKANRVLAAVQALDRRRAELHRQSPPASPHG